MQSVCMQSEARNLYLGYVYKLNYLNNITGSFTKVCLKMTHQHTKLVPWQDV